MFSQWGGCESEPWGCQSGRSCLSLPLTLALTLLGDAVSQIAEALASPLTAGAGTAVRAGKVGLPSESPV